MRGLEKASCGWVVFKRGYTSRLVDVTTREGFFL